jgi:hypothetical protein
MAKNHGLFALEFSASCCVCPRRASRVTLAGDALRHPAKKEIATIKVAEQRPWNWNEPIVNRPGR